jgi:DNA-binding winged helix-turn-helix (wHTH) protein
LNRAEPDIAGLQQTAQTLMLLAGNEGWINRGLEVVGNFLGADVVGLLKRAQGETKYQMWLNPLPVEQIHPQMDVVWVERLLRSSARIYDAGTDDDVMAQTHLLMLGWGSLLVAAVQRPWANCLMFAARSAEEVCFTEKALNGAVILAQQLVLLMEGTGSILRETEKTIDSNRLAAHSQFQEIEPLMTQCPLGREVQFNPIRRVLSGAGQSVSLTATEARLLSALLHHRHKLVSYALVVQLISGYQLSESKAARMIRPILSRLRKKLSVFEGGQDWIVSVRGTGLILD